MEQNSSRVLSGKIVHEDSYKRMKNKEILIDDILKLDIIGWVCKRSKNKFKDERSRWNAVILLLILFKE